MRVLHVIPGMEAQAGGPVFAMIGQAQAQRSIGHQVHVAAAWYVGQEPPSPPKALEQAGVKVTLIGPLRKARGISTLQARKALYPLVQESDVVHIHAVWESIVHQASLVCRELHKPYIFHPCGMLDVWAMRRSRLKKLIYWHLRAKHNLQAASGIQVDTFWEREQVKQLGLRPPIVVVPNSVDLAEFEHLPPQGQFRPKFPAIQDRPLIVFLGRVFPGKGVEMLIPALAKMQNRSAMLAVCGPDSGGYIAKMQELARQCAVEDRVIFAGMMHGRQRIEALVDADLFSLPSEHENFGIAALEAMAAGTAVVVSDQVGISGDVNLAQAGEVVPLDSSALARALDDWLSDTSRRRSAGERGRTLVFDRFTSTPIARRWAQVYEELSLSSNGS